MGVKIKQLTLLGFSIEEIKRLLKAMEECEDEVFTEIIEAKRTTTLNQINHLQRIEG